MHEIVELVKNTVSQNQIVSAVASGGLVVWLITNIKLIWTTIKRWILNLISFTVTNLYEDSGYEVPYRQQLFNIVISNSKSLWERSLNFDLKQMTAENKNNMTYGYSIRWLCGALCEVNRYYRASSTKNNIITDIRVYFTKKSTFMNKLKVAIDEEYNKREKKQQARNWIGVYTGAGRDEFLKNKRSLSSIFTNNDEHMRCYNDIKKFIDNKKIYTKLNYPYKYCCMLHGKPGCGKTSTILAVASELNRDIIYINLSTATIQSLTSCLANNSNTNIYVFEDIDALNNDTVSSRVDDKNAIQSNQSCNINVGTEIKLKTLSLSDLLNVTDGLLSNDGTICIFTTNHIEKLDPALLRAGRMNNIIEFDYLNAATASKMIKTHLGQDCKIDNLQDNIKPAELQEMLLNIKTGHATVDDLIRKFCKK